MDKDKIINNIKLLDKNVFDTVGAEALSVYIDNANQVVQTYNAPESIQDELVRLLACSKVNTHNASDSTGVKIGQIDMTYQNSKSSSDDPWLDDFNELLNRYGLNAAELSGF